MTTIAPSINYWDLLEEYRAGIQPVYPDQSQSVDDQIDPPRGIIELFPNDVLMSHSNLEMQSLISKYSPPSKREFSAKSNPQLDKFVFNRRVLAHLGPLSLYVY